MLPAHFPVLCVPISDQCLFAESFLDLLIRLGGPAIQAHSCCSNVALGTVLMYSTSTISLYQHTCSCDPCICDVHALQLRPKVTVTNVGVRYLIWTLFEVWISLHKRTKNSFHTHPPPPPHTHTCRWLKMGTRTCTPDSVLVQQVHRTEASGQKI